MGLPSSGVVFNQTEKRAHESGVTETMQQKPCDFVYPGSLLHYYDYMTYCTFFSLSLSRILKQYYSRSDLRLGIVGYETTFGPLVYTFQDQDYTLVGCFGDNDKIPLKEYREIEEIASCELEVIFIVQEDEYLARVLQMTAGRDVKIVPLSRLVDMDLQVLMSVTRNQFFTCLSPTKFSVIALCNALAPQDGLFIECGVYLGGTTIFVAKYSQLLGIKRNIYALDTFAGMPSPVEKDGKTEYKEGCFSDSSWERVAGYYKHHGVRDQITMCKGLVQDTLPQLPLHHNVSFALVDTDQYSGTKAGLAYLLPHLREEGIIVVDDTILPGVDTAIEESLKEFPGFKRIRVYTFFDIIIHSETKRNLSFR
jgi:hypothetical protein